MSGRGRSPAQLDLRPPNRHIDDMTEATETSAADLAARKASNGQFTLSQAAADRITVMLENEPDGSFFRVAVNGGGCSGFQYEFSIDSARGDDDLSFVCHDVEVVIDDISLELVENAELDYVKDLMGAYFAVSNPNATASCGCGTSFSV